MTIGAFETVGMHGLITNFNEAVVDRLATANTVNRTSRDSTTSNFLFLFNARGTQGLAILHSKARFSDDSVTATTLEAIVMPLATHGSKEISTA